MSRSFKKESRSSSVLTVFVEAETAGADSVTPAVAVTGSATLAAALFGGALVILDIDSPGFRYILNTSFTNDLVSSSHA